MTCKRTLIHAQSTLWTAPQNLQFTLWNSGYRRSAYLAVKNSRCSIPCNPSILKGYLSEFNLWVLPLVTWIDGFLDWISMEGIFKILQFHNLWSNECKMDEYCFRFALWRWNSPFVEASTEHKWSERFIAMFNATKHNIRPFHIHAFVSMWDCNILYITWIIKFNLKIRNTTCTRQFTSETPA